MKKTRSSNKGRDTGGEMLAEYRFDYSKARKNRFAGRMRQGVRAIVLDADVAEVFSTTEAVNAVLRALIKTMPRSKERK